MQHVNPRGTDGEKTNQDEQLAHDASPEARCWGDGTPRREPGTKSYARELAMPRVPVKASHAPLERLSPKKRRGRRGTNVNCKIGPI